MAATWEIVNLNRELSLDGKSDVVTAAHWQVIDAETVGSGDDAVTHNGRALWRGGAGYLRSFILYSLRLTSQKPMQSLGRKRLSERIMGSIRKVCCRPTN